MTKNSKTSKPEDGAPESVSVGLDRSIDKLESRRDSKEERRVAGMLRGQRARVWTEKLITRTLSGVIYVVVIVGCFFWGVIPSAALMAVMGWLCCSEFFRICRMGGRRPNEIFGLTAAVAYPLVAVLTGPHMLLAVTSVLLMASAGWYVFNPRANISDVAITVFGPVYTSLTLSGIALIRAAHPSTAGAVLALIVMGSIWAEDSLAYLVGSTLGKHKMAPRISPNKSWEGFYGGIAGSLVVWVVGAAFRVGGLTWPLALACGVTEAIVAVFGDLFESRIKRGVGVKDSGNLLPGHGGLLDRMDSVLFGGMVAYFVLLLGGML